MTISMWYDPDCNPASMALFLVNKVGKSEAFHIIGSQIAFIEHICKFSPESISPDVVQKLKLIENEMFYIPSCLPK